MKKIRKIVCRRIIKCVHKHRPPHSTNKRTTAQNFDFNDLKEKFKDVSFIAQNCFTRQFMHHLDRRSNVPFQWSYIFPAHFIRLVRNITTINLKNISTRIIPKFILPFNNVFKNYVIIDIDNQVECHFIHDMYDQTFVAPKIVQHKYEDGNIARAQKSNDIENVVKSRFLRRLERMKNMVFIVTFEDYCIKNYNQIKDVLDLEYVVLFFNEKYRTTCKNIFDKKHYDKIIFYYLNKGEVLTVTKNSQNFMNQFFNSFHLPTMMPCYDFNTNIVKVNN